MGLAATASISTTYVPNTRQIHTTSPVLGGGPLSSDLTLSHAASGVTAGTYGDGTHVPQFTVDADGHVTGVTEVAITGGGGGGTTTDALTFDVTGGGVLNMLEAVRLYQRVSDTAVRYYQASSAEMFGHAQEIPLRETSLFHPRSPYGAAKAYGHYMTVNYRESYGMHASSAMLFNHESPRRGTEFVTRRITQAVARIALGLQDGISLGNLQAQRDWGYAGDYVEAMYLMLQQDTPDDYVLATGEAHSVADFLDLAFAVIGVDDWSQHVRLDPAQLRPAEVDVLIGDATKARSALGWKPRMSFVELVETMVESDIRAQSLSVPGSL